VSVDHHHTIHHLSTLALTSNTDYLAIDTALQDAILGSEETVIVTQVNASVATQVNTETTARNHAPTAMALAHNTLEVAQYAKSASSETNVNSHALNNAKAAATKQQVNAINAEEGYMETFVNFNVLPLAVTVFAIEKLVNVNIVMVKNSEPNVRNHA